MKNKDIIYDEKEQIEYEYEKIIRRKIFKKELIHDIFILLILFGILAYFFSVGRVSGTSMYPSLKDGDLAIFLKHSMKIETGDVIVIYNETDKVDIVKRVIAKDGDYVDIDFNAGIVYVNDRIIREPYITAPTTQQYDVAFPITVPKDKYFVMGDNREVSKDSRTTSVGLIDKEDVLGKVVLNLSRHP